MPPTSASTWRHPLLLTSASACPAVVARASGRAAISFGTSPSDQERPPFDVEINGVKVRSTDGRTPTSSDGPAEASTRPPLVAVAVASTRLDQETEPLGRKNSCQNVLRGSSSRPIGMVAHVPSEVWTDVARGVGVSGAVMGPSVSPSAVPLPEHPSSPATDSTSAIRTAAGRGQRIRTHGPLPHCPFRTVLIVFASITANDDSVAEVAGPGPCPRCPGYARSCRSPRRTRCGRSSPPRAGR